MRALLRNEGETITEDMNVPGIDWETGAPLTNSRWAGGPYVLVIDHPPAVEEVILESEVSEDVIDASKAEQIAELKKLLAELEK